MRYNHVFNKHYTDLGRERVRRTFYHSDFTWNRYFSPDVYLRLLSVKTTDGVVVSNCTNPQNSNAAPELVIEMSRVDSKNNLFDNMVRTRKFAAADAFRLGKLFEKRVLAFPRKNYELVRSKAFTAYMEGRAKDLDNWFPFCKGYVSDKEARQFLVTLRSYLKKHGKEMNKRFVKEFSVTLDAHTANLFLDKKGLKTIDVYCVKKEWRGGSYLVDIFRIAADILILTSTNSYNAFIAGCKTARPDMNTEHALFYMYYAALIKGPYLHLLAKDNPGYGSLSMLYLKFIRESQLRLESQF